MREKIKFVLAMVIFGAVGVFAKWIDLSSGEIALCLSFIGALSLLVFIAWSKRKISWRSVKKNAASLLIGSFALSCNWIFLFQAFMETTIANAVLSYYFAPVLVILLSPVVLKEKLSIKKVVCIGTALAGLYLIVQNAAVEPTGRHLAGIGHGLIAAGFYAGLTLVNKVIRNLDGLAKTLLQFGLSVVILFPYVLIAEGLPLVSVTESSIMLILVLGILHGGVGFSLFFSGMQGLSGQSIAVLSYIDPLTSLFISVLVIGENTTLQQLAGAALLLGSIWIGESGGKKGKINGQLNHSAGGN